MWSWLDLKLPAREKTEIAEEKIRGYLLSSDHPVGRHKARFFRHLGFGAVQLA
ncbi:DUF6883 domain-containing protein [Wenzhouxiangella sp. EGI_FJ10409]|uniref:DUF6883 domain-containing protein n=1 Tax=Wenzhouxiangella sp. EGI_FJ10409 TaxID=3243767 RepID=UPI0035DA7DB3